MSEEQIQQIYQFDYEVYKGDRAFYQNNTSLEGYEEVYGELPVEGDFVNDILSSVLHDVEEDKLAWVNAIENEALRKAIKKLTPTRIEILRLISVEAKTQREVGQIMGVTEADISCHMREIRKIIGKALGRK